MQDLLFGQLCIVQVVCYMDNEKVRYSISYHLSDRKRLYDCFPVFGVKQIEKGASDAQTLIACKDGWQFLLEKISKIFDLLDVLGRLTFNIVKKDGLNK